MKKKLSDKEISQFWTRLRKEDEKFDDWSDARDEVVKTIGHYELLMKVLIIEQKKWDKKVEKMFQMKTNGGFIL